ncbi:MAG TPA: hypothetical protein VGB48_10325 [Allosphingosinicella sp.]
MADAAALLIGYSAIGFRSGCGILASDRPCAAWAGALRCCPNMGDAFVEVAGANEDGSGAANSLLKGSASPNMIRLADAHPD